MKMLVSIVFFSFFSLAARAEKTSLTYKELTEIINSNNVQSIEALLPLLPEGYRKHYTFVYQSRSLQANLVTPEFPRTIIYGSDAKLVLAFSRSGPEPLANALEIIEYDETRKAYDFRMLTFQSGQNPLSPAPEVNPQRCKNCHGQDPRPNWDAYNVWPGAFGSVTRGGCDAVALNSKEHKYYLDFLSNQRLKNRYQFLPKEITPSTTRIERCNMRTDEERMVTNAASTDPNSKLNLLFTQQNYQRVRRILLAAPDILKFRFVLKASDMYCDNSPEYKMDVFFGPKYFERTGFRSEKKVEEHILTEGPKQFARLKERVLAFNSGSPTNRGRQPIDFGTEYLAYYNVAWLSVLLERLNLPTRFISNMFTDGDYNFATAGDTSSAPITHSLLPKDTVDESLTCEELKQLSLAEFNH